MWCPVCETNGIREILGEVDSSGIFAIKRFHSGFTKISSEEFEVICGRCNTSIFQRIQKEEYKQV